MDIPDCGSSHCTKEGNTLLLPPTLVSLFAAVIFFAASIGLGSSAFAKDFEVWLVERADAHGIRVRLKQESPESAVKEAKMRFRVILPAT